MSTAGSGDVLSGILAGICGYVKDEDLTLGVAAGAYLNGRAGELAQEISPRCPCCPATPSRIFRTPCGRYSRRGTRALPNPDGAKYDLKT